MEKNRKQNNSYVYGNVAYNIEPVIKEERKIAPSPRKRVEPKKKSYSKVRIVTGIGIVSLMSFLLLCRFASIIKLTWDVRDLKNEIKIVQQKNENTRVDIARLNNIRSIEAIAISKCGMVFPTDENVISLKVKPITTIDEKENAKAANKGYNIMEKLFGFIN